MQLSRYCSSIGDLYRSRVSDIYRSRIGDLHRYWPIAVVIAAALGMAILGLQSVGIDLCGLDTGHVAYNAILRSALQSF
jgi:hypothetical protein